MKRFLPVSLALSCLVSDTTAHAPSAAELENGGGIRGQMV